MVKLARVRVMMEKNEEPSPLLLKETTGRKETTRAAQAAKSERDRKATITMTMRISWTTIS